MIRLRNSRDNTKNKELRKQLSGEHLSWTQEVLGSTTRTTNVRGEFPGDFGPILPGVPSHRCALQCSHQMENIWKVCTVADSCRVGCSSLCPQQPWLPIYDCLNLGPRSAPHRVSLCCAYNTSNITIHQAHVCLQIFCLSTGARGSMLVSPFCR